MSIEKVVDALNGAFAADPGAIHALIVNRVPCNQALADDPFVQVDCPPVLRDGLFQVGAIGLINGVLAAIGLPLAATMFSDEKDSDGRSKLIGFTVYKPVQSEVAAIQSPEPQPDQYWQHKTSEDRVYFIGRTPDGEMVWQCEGDNVEIGDLDWSGWEYLPGCDSWEWQSETVPGVPEYPKYWDTDGPTFAYIVQTARNAFKVIKKDGSEIDGGWWIESDERHRKQLTPQEVLAIERSNVLARATGFKYPQWYVPVKSTISHEHGVRIAYLRRDSDKTGETFLVNGLSFKFYSIGFKPDELYVVTEDEAKSRVNTPAAVKAPSDVMGQSPDDWVPQDRVEPRHNMDQIRWSNFPDGMWVDPHGDWTGELHGFVDNEDRSTLSVRCRRKDLPVVNSRIPVTLYWYDGAIVGRYADSPVTDPSFVPIHSDGNGGWFIERSEDAGN